MVFLESEDKSLELVLGGAVSSAELTWAVAFLTIGKANFDAREVTTQHGLSDGDTPVEIVPAPSAVEFHQVKSLSVFNADDAPAEVTLQLDDNGTKRVLLTKTLVAGEVLFFDGSSFSIS